MKENKPLKLTINKEHYDWSEQYITGLEIKELAGINPKEELYLAIKEPWEDELIENETRVNLARPRIEHFFTVEKDGRFKIIVNGSLKEWEKKRIEFKEVIELAYGGYIDKPTMVYTVAYEDGPKANPEGSMLRGTIVVIKNKMIFHATATDKS